MNLALIIIAISVLIYFYIKRQKQAGKVDYSFGLESAKKAKMALITADFKKTENLLNQMVADDLTQTIDYLTLSLPESTFIEWNNHTKSDLSMLCLGVYYSHQAWISRSNKLAKNVSEKAAEGFFEYNQKAQNYLETMPQESKYLAESFSRLIRISMADGNSEAIEYYFQKAISIDSKRLWPYLHYCEAIQPKWGGDIDHITDLINSLPDEPIVQHGVMLKLLSDSNSIGENYFPNQSASIDELIKSVVQKIDEKITKTPLDSIHKYIIYNYLWLLSQEFKLSKINNKYNEMIQGYLTLYPFGIR